MNTKILLLGTVLMFVALKPVKSITDEQMQKMAKGMRNSCLPKVGTTEDLVDGLRRGEFPDDQNLKCYTHCIMKTMRTFKNGAIDFNMVKKQIEMSMPADRVPRLIQTINQCSELEYTGDQCQVSFDYVKCVQNTDPAAFFFP